MAEALILEFEGVGREDYDAVNGTLGTDPYSGGGDWPEGIRFHAAGAKPGGWLVFEVWDSREPQERFMSERLGPALQQHGVAAPTRAEWLDVAAHTWRG